MQIWGREVLWKRKTPSLSPSKNIMFKRRALYRAAGMTQQAMEWQPVWAHAAPGGRRFSQALLATQLQLADEK